VLEYLPDPVVPCRGSRLLQGTCQLADPIRSRSSGETLLPGRAGHGAVHAYDAYWAETEVRRPDGTLLVADRLNLSPGDGDDLQSLGRLGS
jgi:urease accessory protein